MASLNKVLIMGNLGSDPELKRTPSGQAVATLNVATNESWTDKENNRQERTEWHRIVVWGRQAEQCGQYLKKGRQVFVEGRIQTRSWEDQQGQKKFMTEIVAQTVQFIGSPGGRGEESPLPEPSGRDVEPPASISDDDVPF
jgi:single-strand DNA-binding protein